MAKKRLDDKVEINVEAVDEHRREFRQFETFASFARRHGEFIIVGDGREMRPDIFDSLILFEDGATARSKHELNHGGQEPPVHDIVGCGRLRLKYAEEKLRREIEDYEQFLADCRQQADWHVQYPNACPPPPADWKEQLAAGHTRVERWQARCAELNDILNQLDPVRIAKRERAVETDAKAQERLRIFNEVMSYGGHVPVQCHVGESISDPI